MGGLRRLVRRLLFAAVDGWPFVERFRLAVRTQQVTLPGLPAALSEIRIGILSDLHVGHYSGPQEASEAVRLLGEARPDLVLLTGDIVHAGANQSDLAAAAEAVAGLRRAPLGVYAVLGNHDHWFGAARVIRALAAKDVPVLVNEAVRIPAGEGCGELCLCGLDSAWQGRPDPVAALRGVAEGAAVLLAVHEPDYAHQGVRSLPGRQVLQVSGHTHGGQVRLPWFGPVGLPPMGRHFVRGLQEADGQRYQVYTCAGVGVTGVPVRWNSPPEVSLLQLTSSPA